MNDIGRAKVVEEGLHTISPSLNDRERKDRIERAAQHIFYTEPADVGAQLCLENIKYGLAKMHCVQEQLGLKPDATFVASPDVTITVNPYRWNNGFGYGGKFSWGDGDDEIVFLETKPNCCGMFVGGLDKLPKKESVMRNAVKMKQEKCKIDDIKIKWNLEKGNHFIDVYELRPLGSYHKFPPYAFMLHTSGAELKTETHLGPGLYIDKSPVLHDMAEFVKTPFGESPVLTGAKAKEYYQFYKVAADFAYRRRKRAAELLFGEFELIVDATHQGLTSQNAIAVGTNALSGARGKNIFPLALQPDLPSYLVEGCQNYRHDMIEQLGWKDRAIDLGVYHRLENADLLPHGAGYNFPQLEKVLRVHEVNGRRIFEVKSRRGEGVELFGDLNNIPFEYRGTEILDRTVALGLGKPVAELIPLYVYKI